MKSQITHAKVVSQTRKFWKPIQNASTLKAYSQLLCQFVTVALRSINCRRGQFRLPLTDGLKEKGKALIALKSDPSPPLKDLHFFLYYLFSMDRKKLEASKWNCPVYSFFAAFSLKESEGFRTATDLTPYLAKMKYAMKTVFFAHAKLRIGMYKDDFRESAKTTCGLYLCQEVTSSYSLLCGLDAYASAIAFTTSGATNLSWDEDFTQLQVNGVRLKMSNFRDGVRKAIEDTKAMLDGLQCGHIIEYKIPEDFVDDMANRSFDYSYVDNAKTVAPDALLQAILNDPGRGFVRIANDGEAIMNHALMYNWLEAAYIAQMNIAYLTQVSGGQPPRGTEAVDCRIRNRERLRNVMKTFGKTTVIYNYNKTTNNMGNDTIVPHQLSDEVGDLFDRFVLVVRPMQKVLGGLVYGKFCRSVYDEFFMVYYGKRMDSPMFSKGFQVFTEKYFHAHIDIQTYRHMAIAIKREYIPEYYYQHFKGRSDIGDYQAGHSTSTANRLYAVNSTGVMKVNTSLLHLCCQFSRQWHNVLGIGRFPPPLPLQFLAHPGHYGNLFTTDRPFEDRVLPEAMNASTSNQVAQRTNSERDGLSSGDMAELKRMITTLFREHETRSDNSLADKVRSSVAEGVVAGLKSSRPAATFKHPFRQIRAIPSSDSITSEMQYSNDSSISLDSYPADPDNDMVPEIARKQIVSAPSAPSSSNENDISRYLLMNMCTTYGQPPGSMRWKSAGQRALLESTVGKAEDVIACIPTGGGKSAVFEVPSATFNRAFVTLIVVPFKAIGQQITQDCIKRGVAMTNWVGRTSSEDPPNPVIVVAAERTHLEDFTKYVPLVP